MAAFEMKSWTTTILTILFLCKCGQVDNRYLDNTSTLASQKTETRTQENFDSGHWFHPTTIDTNINFSEKIQLTLKYTDSISISEYFLNSKIIDSLIKPYNNSHIKALEIEKYLLKTYRDFAKRDSNGLHIKLKNGDWKLLIPDSLTDEADNTFEYYFKDLDFYSIRTQWIEGSGYKLVNSKDGTVTHLFGRPYFSPNGQFMVSVNADIEAGYSHNGFQLFKNNNGQLKHIGNYEPSAWGPYSAKWLNNSKLILRNHTIEYKNGNMDYIDFYIELKIKKGDS